MMSDFIFYLILFIIVVIGSICLSIGMAIQNDLLYGFAVFACCLFPVALFSIPLWRQPIKSSPKTAYNITVMKATDTDKYIVEFNGITLDNTLNKSDDNYLKIKEYFSDNDEYYLTYNENTYINYEKLEDYILYVPLKANEIQSEKSAVSNSAKELADNYEILQTVH